MFAREYEERAEVEEEKWKEDGERTRSYPFWK